MSVLGYSALNKIKKTLDTKFGEQDRLSIVSKEVTIDYNDIAGGNTREIILGHLPENCVLMHSSINVDIPFNISGGGDSPRFSLGLSNEEDSFMDYPSLRDYRFLVFNQYNLGTVESVDYQGETSGSADKLLNEFSNSLVARFEMLGVWSAGGNLSSARTLSAGSGSQSAGLIFSGLQNGSYLTTTEEYNGSSWSAGGNVVFPSYYSAAAGTQNAGLKFGGKRSGVDPIGATEYYNGTTWAQVNSMNVARRGLGGCGTQSAALSFAGFNASIELSTTEEFDGVTWTSVNSTNIATREGAGSGIQTSALKSGGTDSNGKISTTEEYNGTNWAITNNLNVARNDSSGCGLQNSALHFGGVTSSGNTDITEEYDGTLWSIGNTLSSAREYINGQGIKSAALCTGGGPIGVTTTEEYDPANLADLTQGSLSLYVTYTHR